tara:strand:+ start:386 stop:595 length:210 start_codon:yes stop_codon:yes gene_type:complete
MAITVITIIVLIYLFLYATTDQNPNKKLITNLENYAQKKEARKQKPKVLVKRKKARTRNKKESVDVHAL